jgi:hypothetical protein
MAGCIYTRWLIVAAISGIKITWIIGEVAVATMVGK